MQLIYIGGPDRPALVVSRAVWRRLWGVGFLSAFILVITNKTPHTRWRRPISCSRRPGPIGASAPKAITRKRARLNCRALFARLLPQLRRAANCAYWLTEFPVVAHTGLLSGIAAPMIGSRAPADRWRWLRFHRPFRRRERRSAGPPDNEYGGTAYVISRGSNTSETARSEELGSYHQRPRPE